MGRTPKPIEVKRRMGNPGKRPLPAVGSLAVVPAAPRAWERLSVSEQLDAVMEAGVHWLASTDMPVIQALADATEDYERLREMGAPFKEIREARIEVTKLLSQLGFDPTARSKLGLAEVRAASKLEELRARRSVQ